MYVFFSCGIKPLCGKLLLSELEEEPQFLSCRLLEIHTQGHDLCIEVSKQGRTKPRRSPLAYFFETTLRPFRLDTVDSGFQYH